MWFSFPIYFPDRQSSRLSSPRRRRRWRFGDDLRRNRISNLLVFLHHGGVGGGVLGMIGGGIGSSIFSSFFTPAVAVWEAALF
ncbi:hypothetical protein M5689_000863 [Euphorbia peplus]|nr:hypothetical protein M5689_000863 [Euphorbia peplus]